MEFSGASRRSICVGFTGVSERKVFVETGWLLIFDHPLESKCSEHYGSKVSTGCCRRAFR